MFNKVFSFVALLSFYTSFLFAQSNFTPQSVGDGINSKEYAEINPVISPDGKTLYFVRVSHPENNHDANEHFGPNDSQDIWFSELQADGTWGKAKRLDNVNHSIYNAILSISDDGKTILINGVYDKKNRWLKRGLSICTKTGNSWSSPQRLKVPRVSRKNKGKASNVDMSGDGKVLFMSYTKRFNGRRQNLYVSVNNLGEWSKPKRLPKLINDNSSSEESPYYNPTEGKLYFASNRDVKGAKNKRYLYDIYVSKKLDNTFLSWSEPKKLSDTVNSPYWESYYKLNPKGSWAYFATNRDNKGMGEPDIYKVKLFEENPYIVVTGQVKDFKKQTLIDYKQYPYKIAVDGKIIDSIVINPDSGKFTVRLPLGSNYVLSAEAKNHRSILDTIVAKDLVEYTETKNDLFLEPVPYVIIYGKILVRGINTPIPSNVETTILSNGSAIKPEEMDYQTGAYKIKLKFGKQYSLSVKAEKYVTDTAFINLTQVNEYKEINRDLYVQKYIAPEPNETVISGKIIDKKTGLPISAQSAWLLNVNDIVANEVNIDYATGTYKMKVPHGKVYLINATANGYFPVFEMIDLSIAAPPKAISKDLVIAPIEVGVAIKLNNIFFETAKATLKKESYPELDRVVKFLNGSPTLQIEIGGHTDNAGKPEVNMKLSQNRANAVVTYLVSQGIAANRLIAKGYGSTKPVANNKTKLGKSQNRRVEFTILSK